MYQAPQFAEKAERTHDSLIAPFEIFLRRRGKEREEPRRVRAVLTDQVLGIDDVFLRLGHFFDAASDDGAITVGTLPSRLLRAHQLAWEKPIMLAAAIGLLRHHALSQQIGERFIDVGQAEIAQSLDKKTRV